MIRRTSILALVFCCLSLSPITAGRQNVMSDMLVDESPGNPPQENSEQRTVMPNPYDVSRSSHDIPESPDLPSEYIRPVMTNPHDEVLQVRNAQETTARRNRTIISALARQALSRQSPDTNSSPRTEITRLLRQPTENDESLILDLLNQETTGLEVERIPLKYNFTSETVTGFTITANGHADSAARSVFPENWELLRDEHGRTIAGRTNAPDSRVPVLPGMVFGAHGRVTELRDTPDAWYLVLENGTRIHGNPESGIAHADF